MKRLALGLVAAAGLSVLPATAASAASYCGDTFQPPCEYCLVEAPTPGQWVCVSIEVVNA